MEAAPLVSPPQAPITFSSPSAMLPDMSLALIPENGTGECHQTPDLRTKSLNESQLIVRENGRGECHQTPDAGRELLVASERALEIACQDIRVISHNLFNRLDTLILENKMAEAREKELMEELEDKGRRLGAAMAEMEKTEKREKDLIEMLEERERREKELIHMLEERDRRVGELEDEVKAHAAEMKHQDEALTKFKMLREEVRSFHEGTKDLLQDAELERLFAKRELPEDGLVVVVEEGGRKRKQDSSSSLNLFTPRKRHEHPHGTPRVDYLLPAGNGRKAKVAPPAGGTNAMLPDGDGKQLWQLSDVVKEVADFEEEIDGKNYSKEEAVQLVEDKVPSRTTCPIQYRGNIDGQLSFIRADLTFFETPSVIVHFVEFDNSLFSLSTWLKHIHDRSKKWKDHVYLEDNEDPAEIKLLTTIPPFSGPKLAVCLWKKKPVSA